MKTAKVYESIPSRLANAHVAAIFENIPVMVCNGLRGF